MLHFASNAKSHGLSYSKHPSPMRPVGICGAGAPAGLSPCGFRRGAPGGRLRKLMALRGGGGSRRGEVGGASGGRLPKLDGLRTRGACLWRGIEVWDTKMEHKSGSWPYFWGLTYLCGKISLWDTDFCEIPCPIERFLCIGTFEGNYAVKTAFFCKDRVLERKKIV